MPLIKNITSYCGLPSMRSIIYVLSIIALLLIVPHANANDVVNTEEAIKNRAEYLAGISFLIRLFAIVLGLILLIKGGFLLKEIADQRTKVGFGGVAVVLISGIMLFSFNGTLSMFVPTMLGNDSEYCFAVHDSTKDSSKLNAAKAHANYGTSSISVLGGKSGGTQCWDAESSDVTEAIHNKIKKMSTDSTAAQFAQSLRTILALFQVIGSIYFIKGIYGLYENAMGTAREPGYGKPIITMVASSFLVDLGHTLELLLGTLRAIGMSF